MEDEEMMYEDDRKDFITYVKEAIGLEPLEIKLKKIDERAVVPSYTYDGDVGMDLTAIDVEYDREKDMYIYHTGIALETDKHYGVLLFTRSSNRNTDAYLCNHVGVADTANYRGEIMFCYKNRTSLEVRAEIERSNTFLNQLAYIPFTTSNGDGVTYNWASVARDSLNGVGWVLDNPMNFAPYKVGERIGQMVVIPHPYVKINEVKELSHTERGEKGFGSSGK